VFRTNKEQRDIASRYNKGIDKWNKENPNRRVMGIAPQGVQLQDGEYIIHADGRKMTYDRKNRVFWELPRRR